MADTEFIELVIKIPEDTYDIMKRNAVIFGRGRSSKTHMSVLYNAVTNGTPLPKGHGRLIDADTLQTEMDKDIRKAMSFVDLKDFVWLAPTIIEAESEE